MQSVLIYSEIVPTILAVIGLYFILSGGLDENNSYLIIGILVFILAVVFPFVSLSILV